MKFPILLGLLGLLAGCSETYTPKPYGYFRIDFPEKAYTHLEGNYPYRFAVSREAVVEPDKSPDAEAYWIDIHYPSYQAIINLSYKEIRTDTSLSRLLADSQRLAYAHTVKADAIQEQAFEKKGVFGLLYLIEGNAASSTQFFITDSTRHFLRGSLYFNKHPNKDSLAPVIAYLRQDIIKIMETASFE